MWDQVVSVSNAFSSPTRQHPQTHVFPPSWHRIGAPCGSDLVSGLNPTARARISLGENFQCVAGILKHFRVYAAIDKYKFT